MLRLSLLFLIGLFLVGCGGPSQEQIQATVAAAVSATAQAQTVATSVAATQEAEAPCSPAKLTAYADSVEPLIGKLERQASVAGSTPRASLGVALQALLDLQEETIAIKAPECAATYHETVVSTMGMYRVAYETFAAQGDETMVQAALMLGTDYLGKIKETLPTLRTGEVPVIPTPAIPT